MRTFTATLIAALAFAPAARAADKIAVIDVQKAMLECDEGKAASTQLQAEMKDKQGQLDVKQKEFTALRDEFEKQGALLNEQTRAQKTAELEKRGEELQRMYMQLQQELAKKESEATKGIAGRMRQVVKEIAEASGFQLVTDVSPVVWASPGLDITTEAIRKYNAKFPYKGATKPAGGKTK
jgi:outer membrane protein